MWRVNPAFAPKALIRVPQIHTMRQLPRRHIASNVAMRKPSWATFLRQPAKTKALAVEAAACLALARFLVVFVRLRRWRHRVSTISIAQERAPVPDLAWKVSWVVRRVAEAVPFTAVCLQQAIAAQWMLRWRGVASQLMVGVRRESEASRAAAESGPPRRLSYHAWLQIGGECVIGCKEVGTYTAFPPFETAGQRLAG